MFSSFICNRIKWALRSCHWCRDHSKDDEVRPIEYDGSHRVGLNNFRNGAAIDVLSHKPDVWQYVAEE